VRELAVLLEHLRRVAPRSAVDPVALAAALAAAIVAAAAAAILITILVQRNSASLLMTGFRSHDPLHGVAPRCAALRGSSSAGLPGVYRRSH
jgi:hypothetical protein